MASCSNGECSGGHTAESEKGDRTLKSSLSPFPSRRELEFTVLTARDGREAVETYNARNDIDLVILDLTMPQMSGINCYYELKKINPDVKAIISSGYSEEDVALQFSGLSIAGFIQKPYKLSALKAVLKENMLKN